MTAQTIGDVRKLIRKAKAVYIRPFFGTCERWVKISKPEALGMFEAYADDYLLLNMDYDHTLSIEDGSGHLYLG